MIEQYNNSKHRKAVIQLWAQVFGYPDSRNDPATSIDRKMAQQDGLFWVAMEESNLAGTIMAGYDGHRGWIYSLAVLPEYRHQGIGSRLLEYALQVLSKAGCPKVNLQIIADNHEVREFYKAHGFTEEPRISMGKVL